MLKGITELPLHYGNSPRWLFQRMKKLARAITKIIVSEYGQLKFLERLSDPLWFQCFACILGFDWHSSGTTTVTLGALKEAIKEENKKEETGIYVCGGKGKTSLKTPEEIKKITEEKNLGYEKEKKLIKASKLSAKIDNSCLQDFFTLYHHSFIFTEKGEWCVIQQGMREDWARRYHWFSKKTEDGFLNDPHTGIISDKKTKPLNLATKESEETRKVSLEIIEEIGKKNPLQTTLFSFKVPLLKMPREHFPCFPEKIKIDKKIIEKIRKENPSSYEELLGIRGVGTKTLRALALLSHLIYGTNLSWKDPCKYAFAHGGKDGWPYPVNKKIYDKSIQILEDAIKQAGLKRKEKLQAIKKLKEFEF